MERIALIRDSTFINNIRAFLAFLSEFLFITRYTDDIVILRDETLASDWLLADQTAKASLMPLLALVFKFLHTGFENVSASVTSWCKVVIMTVRAVNLFVLRSEMFIYKGLLTITTFEATFVPMLVFVRQILGLSANWFLAFFTCVGEIILVTFDTIRMLFSKDVTMTGQGLIAVPATEMTTVPILFHCFCIFTVED